MSIADLDRGLLERCLDYKPRSWEDFVDRFLGLVLHVIDHTITTRGIRLAPADRDNLCEEVFAAIHHHDYRILRQYQGRSSLATYLTVATRRIVVRIIFNSGFHSTEPDGPPPHRWSA